MLPLIYTNALAAVMFIAACLVWNLPEMVGMWHQTAQVSRQTASIQDHHSMRLLIALEYIGIALDVLIASFVTSTAISWYRPVVFAMGISLMLLGVALRWYAITTLGKYFTRDVAVTADQPVVRHGVYRFIRHPSYSGTFLTMLGLGLALGNWLGLLILLGGVFLGHSYRVRVEELALARGIGQPYMDYMRQTRRFIPWLF